jgi:hypothetical protein
LRRDTASLGGFPGNLNGDVQPVNDLPELDLRNRVVVPVRVAKPSGEGRVADNKSARCPFRIVEG